ncbi:MAG TPA: alanine--tRNA ligase-related protein, partial [Nitrospiria bacterium]|nr:alanine--tRNA ligase-related protein [Nitrospiria bacterium]
TLRQGMGILKDLITKARDSGEALISGEEAFRLYDTYGFPLDITKDMARDSGLRVDEEGYRRSMEEQKTRAREAWVVKEVEPHFQEAFDRLGATEFVGYDRLEEEVRLIGILRDKKPVDGAAAGQTVELVLDRTPFYGESGGQVGDQGYLETTNGLIEVHATLKPVSGFFVHQGKVAQGEIRTGETLRAVVNPQTRWGAARNHTATHLLHAALREVLGEHVKQAGSLVTSNRLRFDFGHFKPLTPQEISQIETIVNERVRLAEPVETRVMGFQDAVREGALAFFDDKYGDEVRVVRISDFSMELCGGTHCRETGQVGLFKLIQEGSVAAGVRRIEALTGEKAFTFVQKQEEDLREIAGLLKVPPT